MVKDSFDYFKGGPFVKTFYTLRQSFFGEQSNRNTSMITPTISIAYEQIARWHIHETRATVKCPTVNTSDNEN